MTRSSSAVAPDTGAGAGEARAPAGPTGRLEQAQSGFTHRPQPAPLVCYVPRVALDWVAEAPAELHRSIEGSLAFVDVSGFTALTERLAARGRAGAEEITDIVGATFTELARIAGAYGADLLKWGGDAALLLFEGPESATRAARSSWLMVRAMRRLGQLRTPAGRIELQVSVGVHSGIFELFLLGELHRELVVAGPGATRTAEMEAAAAAGEVVVSQATAELLVAAGQGGVLGSPVPGGVRLASEPAAEERPALPLRAAGSDDAAALLLPEQARRYLLAPGEQAEHRPVAIGFVQLGGLDALIERLGAPVAAELLDPVVRGAQEAAERHAASFHATDIAADGVKIILLGGVPTLHGDDADRVLRAALEMVRRAADASLPLAAGASLPLAAGASLSLATDASPGRGLSVRAGVNVGKTFVFVSDLGLGGRRIYSITGDAVNLAARLVAAAEPGEVRCTEAAARAMRSRFVLRQLGPFAAKGKSEPVVTFAVDEGATGLHRGSGRMQAGFVGRAVELEALLSAATSAVTGAGGVVELVGAAGIGKSRLVEEATTRWSLPTWRVSCDAFGVTRPYRPLRALARQLLALDDDAPPELVAEVLVATLGRRAPDLLAWAALLADVFDVSLPPTREVDELEPRFRRRRLESAFVDLAGELVSGPAAFVFEDVHALDEASASLAVRLAEETALRPWLVVATRRPDGAGVPAGELTGRTVIELGALDPASSEDLLAGSEGDGLGLGDRTLLVQRAAGNPLFLLELARASLATGSSEELPDALEPLLAAQVDRLEPADRQVLRTAAVLGQRFDERLLAEVLDDATLLDGELWGRLEEFLLPDGAGLHGVERVFTHALVREAAYEGLAFRRRRVLHARAGEAIERRAGGADNVVEQLSLHWLAAERWEPAWQCARVAGERAAALYANGDAARHFRRAMAAARHLPELPTPELVHVGELLGDVCELTGSYERARRAYDEARRRASSAVDRARLLRKVGVLYERQGRYPQALRCYSLALRRLEQPGTEVAVERVELGIASSGIYHRQGRLRQSVAVAIAAGEEAAPAGFRRGLGRSLYLRHINSVYLNEPEDSLGSEALAIFVELGDLVGQGNALNNLGISAYWAGAWNRALEHYAASRDARERTGDLVGAATEENNIGEILSDQGHHAEAERCFGAARSAWRAARYPVGEAVVTANLGRLAARTGRAADGAKLLGEAIAAFESIHASSFVAETEAFRVECTLLGGDAAAVVDDAGELAARLAGRGGCERPHAWALWLQGVALARLGRDGEAEPVLERGVTHLRASGDLYGLALALRDRGSLRRRLARAGAGDDEAESNQLLERLGVTEAALAR